ncbi:MAG: hypothetical protein V3R96_07370 [Dehalococcoidales bacterium]
MRSLRREENSGLEGTSTIERDAHWASPWLETLEDKQERVDESKMIEKA